MKTICFFNTTKAWGGGEKWHLETCKYMHDKGHNVFFITNKNSQLYHKLQESSIKHAGLSITNQSFLNPFAINEVKNILKENNIDVIIINLSRDLKIAALAAKKAGLDRVIYRRGSAIPIKNKFLNRYYFKNLVTDILANSQATKETVLVNNSNLFPREKIEVIYNGLDIEAFIQKAYTPIYKKAEGEFVLTNLGRLENQKNQKFLLHLAKELKSRNLNFKLIIGGEGSLKNELQKLSDELNINDVVLFPGFIENPKDLMYSGDLFVLSSFWEGFGYVLAEASLCRKPIIAFDISSNPEVVKDNETGFLTPLNDVKLFADKVDFLSNNKEKTKSMGEAGFNFASTTFNSKITLAKIEEYLLK
ncbi:Glycosyltransferase involved in cell wall bisynthesis [Algibacter lectus]|uniref:glycosyltransferase n=1 Tax=Algibacter lectus TaxID=221126 RepID=UPI0008F2D960|nr:glycosyltransferase [Algibacter lectus]SFD06183.1 Glycosyltransferase involved in cell wall bisynthesis [Algibacter lectus]